MAAKTMNAATDPEWFGETVAILSRYPEIAESDRQDVLRFLRKAPALDNALLTCVSEVQAQLAAFRQDHRRDLEPGSRAYALLVVAVLALVAICILLWDVGG